MRHLIFTIACVLTFVSLAAAQTTTQPAVTVAILDFDSAAPASPDMGGQMAQILAASLSGQSGVELVDRSSMTSVLAEHSLNLSGLVSADDAIKIGHLVGAKVLITGKIFAVDDHVFITAKLIGTETSLVQGVLVRGDKGQDVSALMLTFSDKVAGKLRDTGPQLIAADDAAIDPLPQLKARLAKLDLPDVSVRVEERHIASVPVVPIDPAVETELRKMLTDCGFHVVEKDGDADVQISGQAFSEYAARIGNLVTCLARVEIKVTRRRTGEVLFADRETTRAVDLAEYTAGKSALQKAAHAIGIRILSHFADTLAAKR